MMKNRDGMRLLQRPLLSVCSMQKNESVISRLGGTHGGDCTLGCNRCSETNPGSENPCNLVSPAMDALLLRHSNEPASSHELLPKFLTEVYSFLP